VCGWNENRRVQAKSVNVVGDILQSITFPSHCHLLWLSILVTASRARAARTTRREASVETGTRRDKTAKNASPTTYRTTRPAPGCRRAPRRSAPPLTHSVVDARCCSACPIVLVSVALAVGRSVRASCTQGTIVVWLPRWSRTCCKCKEKRRACVAAGRIGRATSAAEIAEASMCLPLQFLGWE
jgi:hypothetical protein